jgi:uncharacterized protein (TIGR00369 family)
MTTKSQSRRTHSPGHDTHKLALPKHIKNTCFGCGIDNPEGMKLKFFVDEEKQQTVCNFRLTAKYQGPPGHAHGGIIATILDEAMGKINKLRHVIALTKTMNIEYMKPVPLRKKLVAVGYEKSVEGRKHLNAAEIRNEAGEVLARCEGLFIAVDAAKMFEKFVR